MNSKEIRQHSNKNNANKHKFADKKLHIIN